MRHDSQYERKHFMGERGADRDTWKQLERADYSNQNDNQYLGGEKDTITSPPSHATRSHLYRVADNSSLPPFFLAHPLIGPELRKHRYISVSLE